MQGWEYKRVDSIDFRFFNDLGKQGWEFAGYFSGMGLFKRPLPEVVLPEELQEPEQDADLLGPQTFRGKETFNGQEALKRMKDGKTIRNSDGGFTIRVNASRESFVGHGGGSLSSLYVVTELLDDKNRWIEV